MLQPPRPAGEMPWHGAGSIPGIAKPEIVEMRRDHETIFGILKTGRLARFRAHKKQLLQFAPITELLRNIGHRSLYSILGRENSRIDILEFFRN
jgi:hypothetical protein